MTNTINRNYKRCQPCLTAPVCRISIIGWFEFMTKCYKIEARLGSSKFYPQNLTHVIKIWLLSGQGAGYQNFQCQGRVCSTANYNPSSKKTFTNCSGNCTLWYRRWICALYEFAYHGMPMKAYDVNFRLLWFTFCSKWQVRNTRNTIKTYCSI